MSDYSSTYPTQSPTFAFDAKAGKLDSRISFSRADTPPTYAAPSSVHYWSNEKHLSSENLLPYSNDLSQSVWTKRNLTVPATNIVAPDGTSSASSLLETSATSTHDFYEEFSAVSGTSYTFTLYAKANGRDTLHVSPQATSTIASVVFDLTAVTSTVISGSADSHSITAIGSTGWYKLQLTVTATASGTGFLQTYFRVGGVTSYAGDATKGAYIWGCQVSSTGETFLNATSGSIHREFASTLKSVANAGDPRFEYDPADGQSVGTAKGLLIEAQATNLQRYGSDFASWSASYNVSISSNSAVGPNGNLEADLIVAASTSTDHYVYDNGATLASGTDYTASVYVKDAGQRYVQLVGASGNFGTTQWATFDLQTGSVDANGVTASASQCGNGWYRIQATMTATGSTQGNIFVTLADSATASRSPSFTGDDYSGVLLFGYQLETGSSASSLVDTGSGSSQLSRAADSCSVADFGFTGGPVSITTEVTAAASADGTQRIFTLFENSDLVSTYFSGGGDIKTFVDVGGSTQVDASILANAVSGTDYKVGISFDTNDYRGAYNGTLGAADTSCTLPTFSSPTLQIGAQSGGSNPLSGHIKRLALYNVALSDVELQSLTSS